MPNSKAKEPSPAEYPVLDPSLLAKARQLGIESSFTDNQGTVHAASAATLEKIASLLETGKRQIEPVEVVWLETTEEEVSIPVRTQGYPPFTVHFILESGSVQDAPVEDTGGPFAWIRLGRVGPGRHRVEILQLGIAQEVCHVIAAPVHPGRLGNAMRLREPISTSLPAVSHGIFLPLHAVRSAKNCGIGDFGDLKNMFYWATAKQMALVGTLPLLASFLEEPCEPSPYSPASRLFWNEIFLDLAAIPEVTRSPKAQTLLQDPDWLLERDLLRKTPLVEYRQVMRLKRKVLEAALAEGFSADPARLNRFETFVGQRPRLEAYARFRAAQTRLGHSWQSWPEPMRSGDLSFIAIDDLNYRYHLAVQFWAHEQMAEVANAAKATPWGLYLDLPLGVNGDSFDVFAHRTLFALGNSGGAPPDDFFTKGQDWGFPPPHPLALREEGYAHIFEVLAHHLQFASVLRIDHIMGLYRLWWVPHGNKATEGAYVRYHAKELFAVYCLSAHKAGALMVGEDLGTVPKSIRPAMALHGIRRLHVVQFGLHPDMEQLPEAPQGAVGSLNTHDLPTFAGFWQGIDIDDRLDLGLIDAEEARLLHKQRAQTRLKTVTLLVEAEKIPTKQRADLLLDAVSAEVWCALLVHLAKGQAGMAVVNIEDAWGEEHPQNVPGTWRERPNWRQKAKHPMEEWESVPGIKRLLELWGQNQKKEEVLAQLLEG